MLNKRGFGAALYLLAARDDFESRKLHARLAASWGQRLDRTCLTIKVTLAELGVLESLRLPKSSVNLGVLQSGWVVTYRHPTKHHIELTVFTPTKPRKKATFQIKNARRRLEAVSIRKINKEAVSNMATKTKAKASKKKKVEDDEIDELEGLEELDDLDDLDDDEPEDEDEDVDEDEDDEDEEEEEAPKKKGRGRPKGKKAPAKKAKGKKKAEVDEDDEDEDDEDDEDEDERPAKKSKAKGKGKKKGAKAAPGEKIKGLSPQGVAEVAEEMGYDTDARAVRVFLRNHEEDFPKDDKFRYDFTRSDAKRIVKMMKKKE